MSDFDFDELDKAVSGALRSPTPTDETPTGKPESAKVNPEPTPISEKPTPPAIRRGSGRFMDVVHPSSDMRSSSRPAVQQAEASSTQSSQENADQQNGFVPPVTKPTVEPEQFLKAEAEPEEKTETPQDLTSLGAMSPVGEWSKPLESPFLPDTKVEKRPLGGAGGAETFASLLETTNEEPLLEAPDEPRLEATTMPDPIDFAAHSMALPIESEDTGIQANEKVLPAEEKTAEQPKKEESLDLLTIDMETEKEVVAEAPTEPVGPTSIIQQYTEQTSAEQSSGAIYDTENYHQPLAHAGKKHSSVWTILGIILLVLLGAGAGVAFYFFVLPML